MRDVSVIFDGQSQPALAIDDVMVPSRSAVAVVGETGSGKSTLVGALAGVQPFSGELVVGEGGVAPVFQETFLFATTIRENLLFGSDRNEHEIREALRVADALEFVDELPAGLDTVVGERGVGLSGGQRQRLALARALLSGREVLVLDDTTSALDPETEARVVRNLMSTAVDRTLVIVASRPSTVAMVGWVVFLSEGRVVEQGTHEELLSRSIRYAALMESYESDRHGD